LRRTAHKLHRAALTVALMPESDPVRPSLVISTSDQPDALRLVLECVGRQTVTPAEILIAKSPGDVEQTDVSTTWARRLHCPLIHLSAPHPMQSRVPVLNQAIRAARSEYLIFIEGDCLPHRRFIEDHLRHAQPNSFVQGRRARVRSRYVNRVNAPFRPMLWLMRRRILGLRVGVRRPWPSIRINDRRLIHGCNFAVWRKDLIRVNGFDESFDEPGYELIELAERLLNSGLTLRTITGQAIVYHLDHRHLARYGTRNSERILERTKQERRTTCDQGLVQNSALEPRP
jgi:hypothetical protein